MSKVNIIIDGINIEADSSDTILVAAKKAGINIPTLCYLKDVMGEANCRVCVVDVIGKTNLTTACNTKVSEGMKIETSNEKVLKARKANVELLLSNHNKDCLSCGKNLKCGLQKLSYDFGCESSHFAGDKKSFQKDESSPCLVRDNEKCILCGRCVSVCKKVQATSAIAKQQRGFNTYIGCSFDKPLVDSTCVGCGQCVLACPTGALLEVSNIKKVMNFFKDPENIVVAQVAPATRVGLGEEFGYPIGTFVEGKMVAALKRLGFNKVFDVNIGADFTVMEESDELIERITKNEKLPLFSSCCPAWVRYCEIYYPQYSNNLSSCKSPSEMMGALVKNYYGKSNNIDYKKIKTVAIMPCTAKKLEITRDDGEVDASLTTRELATFIKYKNIDFNSLPDEIFDNPLGNYSGAGLIFGATGGVTEAVLRTAVDKITKKDNKEIDFKTVRNSSGVKEVEIEVENKKLKICVVSGLSNAKKVVDDIVAGRKHFDFIEVMACPGGCINGGGQPFVDYSKTDVSEVIKMRAGALYKKDNELANRKSHKNPALVDVYEKFLLPNKNNKILLHHHHENN